MTVAVMVLRAPKGLRAGGRERSALASSGSFPISIRDSCVVQRYTAEGEIMADEKKRKRKEMREKMEQEEETNISYCLLCADYLPGMELSPWFGIAIYSSKLSQKVGRGQQNTLPPVFVNKVILEHSLAHPCTH